MSVGSNEVYLHRLYETEVIKLGEASFAVYEMIKDGTYLQIFVSVVCNDLNELCFSSLEQVDEFCHAHSDKLQSDGYSTFFLFKKGKEFFVASAYFDSDICLKIIVLELWFDFVWRAEFKHRLVVPQQ